MLNKLKEIQENYKDELKKILNNEEVEIFRVKYLGRKGLILALSKKMKDVPTEKKPEAGKLLNQVKKEIEQNLKIKIKSLKSNGSKNFKRDFKVDLTLPGKVTNEVGHLHLMTKMNRIVSELFKEMGFEYVEGPEVSDINHCFDNMNFPKDHPARDSMDTFELDVKGKSSNVIVRPHLSGIVARQLRKKKAPFKIFFNGRCYRNENVDAKHGHTFHQMEAWIIDEKEASFANAKYIMKEILKRIFGKELKLRLRTGFFPFVEPGFEGDAECVLCGGKGCKTCGYEGWLELFPGGMIHPNVLRAGGVDPDKYEGLAINFGWDRMAMLAHQIDDLRHILGGDLRFIRQF